MKICLINPPSLFLLDPKVFPSLGLLKIAAYLEQNKHDVTVLDLADEENWKSRLFYNLFLDNYEYIGITATTPQIPTVYQMCRYIKSVFPSIKIILGGPHVTLSYGSIKRKSTRSQESFLELLNYCDKTVIGYGELGILKALEPDSPEIIDTETDKSLSITNSIYDSLPMPARHLIDMNSYHYTIDGKKATSIISQLGCPFACGFCSGRNSDTYRKIRTRSIDSVIKEIDYLYKTYNYKGFMFYDDELNVSKRLFEDLLYALIDYQRENDVVFSFRGFSRADLLTEDQAHLMFEAGFRVLLIGFESGSEKMLQSMGKHTTVEQNTKAFDIARKSGLKVKALMSVGHPGESLETIEETAKWLKQVKPDETDVTIVTEYPGSDYHDKSRWDVTKWVYKAPNEELLFSKDIDFLRDNSFYKTSQSKYECSVFTPWLTAEDIVKSRDYLDTINGK